MVTRVLNGFVEKHETNTWCDKLIICKRTIDIYIHMYTKYCLSVYMYTDYWMSTVTPGITISKSELFCAWGYYTCIGWTTTFRVFANVHFCTAPMAHLKNESIIVWEWFWIFLVFGKLVEFLLLLFIWSDLVENLYQIHRQPLQVHPVEGDHIRALDTATINNTQEKQYNYFMVTQPPGDWTMYTVALGIPSQNANPSPYRIP